MILLFLILHLHLLHCPHTSPTLSPRSRLSLRIRHPNHSTMLQSMCIEAWSLEVLPAVDEPLHGGYDKHEEKCYYAVVCVGVRAVMEKGVARDRGEGTYSCCFL